VVIPAGAGRAMIDTTTTPTAAGAATVPRIRPPRARPSL